MMKSNRTTIVLLVLFFGGLLAMWGLDLSGVRPRWEVERHSHYVLPVLLDTPLEEIRRVAIDRGDEHLVFDRRGKGLGHWQMRQPKDVAAYPSQLEALVRNLKELRKNPDARTIESGAETYGLTPPAAIVRLYAGPDDGSASSETPVAELEIGKVVHDRRYVRPVGGAGTEVVDARLLAAVDRPAGEWREPNLVAVPSFQVDSVKITRRDPAGKAPLVIRAERSASGRWKLTAPIDAPANGPKVESLLGALASLHVAEPPTGYVADDVRDLANFGLAEPPVTIELTTMPDIGTLALDIGKPVPDDPQRVYVRQGGQDDVVMVEARALSEVPADATALRSREVADIVPAAVTEIEIRTRSDVFDLKRERGGWELTSPHKERADGPAVQQFLARIDELQTSEFLEPQKVPDAMLEPPVMSIRIRQAAARPSASKSDAGPAPALHLRLGRHDILKKTIFARLEGDNAILALPDTLLDVLPTNPLAFRDRSVIRDSPAEIKKLAIRRGERFTELVPDTTGAPNQWRMLRPVEARADAGTVTQALTALSSLRAEDFAAPAAGDGKAFGLDRPLMQVDWESEGSHHLKVGAAVPRTTNFYATTDAQPMVFTLPAATLRLLSAEYHDHHVMSFPVARARRIVLRFPGRNVTLIHRPPQTRGQVEWVPEQPGSDVEGIDLSRIGSLVATMSRLETLRFIQYEGEIPADTGLAHPRLKVELTLGPKDPTQVLRIGNNADDGNVCAATGSGSSGPAFFLPGPPWNELIRSGEKFPPLPDDVFAPPPS